MNSNLLSSWPRIRSHFGSISLRGWCTYLFFACLSLFVQGPVYTLFASGSSVGMQPGTLAQSVQNPMPPFWQFALAVGLVVLREVVRSFGAAKFWQVSVTFLAFTIIVLLVALPTLFQYGFSAIALPCIVAAIAVTIYEMCLAMLGRTLGISKPS